MVDDFVVVDTGYDERGRIVFAGLLYALSFRFLGVPALRSRGVLFGLRDEAQELNVARGKEVPAAVHVDYSLAGLYSFTFHELVELALLFLDGVLAAGCVGADGAGSFVCSDGVAGCCSP